MWFSGNLDFLNMVAFSEDWWIIKKEKGEPEASWAHKGVNTQVLINWVIFFSEKSPNSSAPLASISKEKQAHYYQGLPAINVGMVLSIPMVNSQESIRPDSQSMGRRCTVPLKEHWNGNEIWVYSNQMHNLEWVAIFLLPQFPHKKSGKQCCQNPF